MAVVNRGLGKGLSALFSDTDAEYGNSQIGSMGTASASKNDSAAAVSDGKPLLIPVERIYANPTQPRKNFDAESLNELSQSIKEHGVIQPIITVQRDGKYMIIAGERRFRAAKLAGLMEIPSYVRDYTDKQIREVSLIENLQREDLNAIEAADAIKQLMEEYSLTQEELSRRIGKSRPAIANLLRLLTLPPQIAQMVREKKLSEGQARSLIGLDEDRAVSLAQSAAEQGLTVRDIERAAKASVCKKTQKKAPQRAALHSRELKFLIEDMQRVFGTKVAAVGSDTKGRIYIDYFSCEDLDRIYDVIEKLKD